MGVKRKRTHGEGPRIFQAHFREDHAFKWYQRRKVEAPLPIKLQNPRTSIEKVMVI